MPTHNPPPVPTKHRSRRPRWGLFIGVTLIALGLLSLVVGGWLTYTGTKARDALQTAAAALSSAQGALLGGDIASANTSIQSAGALTSEAQSLTSDPVWMFAGAIPLLGNTPRSVTLASDAADEVVSGALPQFVEAARVLDFNTLKDPEGNVDLTRFRPTAEQLRKAQASLLSAQATMSDLPSEGVPGFVLTGTSELNAQLDEALGISFFAADILEALPGLLGENGPQRYFVAFQSPVEIRGTGGFLGSYGLLTVDQGSLVNRDVRPNSDLRPFRAPVVDLGPDYARLYGPDVRLWQNMNMSPNYPYAARQWAQATQLAFGESVAGVLAVDITAMQYLLEATGPVIAPDGREITAENVIQFLGNDIYLEFEFEDAAREDYQGEIAVELIDRVLELDGGIRGLIPALTKSVSGGHLQLWAQDDSVQELVASTPLGGLTPITPGPYAQVVLNNGAGNKLDFYTSRRLEYSAGSCRDGYRSSRVQVDLENTLSPEAPLPRSLTGLNEELRGAANSLSNRTIFYVHLPLGAAVLEARVNGRNTDWQLGQELGRPVVFGTVDLPPQTPVTIEVDIFEPISELDPVVEVQPMVKPQETIVDWSTC